MTFSREEQFRYDASRADLLQEDWYDRCGDPAVRAHWFNLNHGEIYVSPEVADVKSLVDLAARHAESPASGEHRALLSLTASRAQLSEFEAGTRQLLCWSTEHCEGEHHISLRTWLTEKGQLPDCAS